MVILLVCAHSHTHREMLVDMWIRYVIHAYVMCEYAYLCVYVSSTVCMAGVCVTDWVTHSVIHTCLLPVCLFNVGSRMQGSMYMWV
ncbi:hypothetical protein EON63_00895 [archaeon]|nr:MAG: hypothetical protein EON63_00895 [archaeon]